MVYPKSIEWHGATTPHEIAKAGPAAESGLFNPDVLAGLRNAEHAKALLGNLGNQAVSQQVELVQQSR